MDGPDLTKNVRVLCTTCGKKHIIQAPLDLRSDLYREDVLEKQESVQVDRYSLNYYGRMFLAGGFAGMCLIATGHPLDTIKVRLQTMAEPKPGESPLYTGAWDCMKKTLSQGGIRVLYRGMAAPLSSVTLANAMYFLGYSIGKRLQQHDNEPLTFPQTVGAAMTAAVFMTPVTVPTDRVKCLLQIQNQPGAQQFEGPLDCLRKLYKTGGITSLYRGGGAAVLLEMPAAAVYFSTYETVKGEQDPERGYIARVLLAGGSAGAISWMVTLPLDMIKSRLMTSSCGKYANAYHVLWKTLQNEGVQSFYKGLPLVVMRAFPANAACLLGYETACRVLNCEAV